jgi:hypothetical protein
VCVKVSCAASEPASERASDRWPDWKFGLEGSGSGSSSGSGALLGLDL